MFSRQYRSPIILSFLILLLICFDVKNIHAHSPHDVIDVLELSPNYDQDKTLFVGRAEHLKMSSDGGFSWKDLVNGLDNTYRFTSIAISPLFNIDRTVFASSEGDGIYRSRDGGMSWKKVNNGLDNLNISLLCLPKNSYNGHILAAGSKTGLFRSLNEGDTWSSILDNIQITAIKFSPVNNKHIFAGSSRGNVYLSRDGGNTWNQINNITKSGAITSLAILPNMRPDDALLIGTEKRGVLQFNATSGTAIEKNTGISNLHITSIAVSPAYKLDKTIFVSGWNDAVFKSEDGGNTWRKYNEGLSTDPQAKTEKYWFPNFIDLRLTETFNKDKTIFLGGFDGLFKSVNGGKTWMQMELYPVSLIMGLAVSSVDEKGSTLAITTYGGGAYTTIDQGHTWSVNSKGLETTRLSDMVFSPDYYADNTIFSASRGYFLISSDRGASWNGISLSVSNWRKQLFESIKRFSLPEKILKIIRNYMLTENDKKPRPFPTMIALSPNFASDKTLFFATRSHGIFKSVDGGINNSLIWDANGQTVRTLIISPEFSFDGTLFAYVNGKGLYKTVNGGLSWTRLTGYPNYQDGKTELAISTDYKNNKTIFAGSSHGLFKTTNGGQSWIQLDGLPVDGNKNIIALALSSNYWKEHMLIVSVKGRGLFNSDDGGLSFTEFAPYLINNNHEIRWIRFSSAYPDDKTIFAASYENLFISTNNGNNWHIIKRPVRYENHRDVLNYEGEWTTFRGDDFSAGSINYSNVANSKVSLNFVGTKVKWIGAKSRDLGIARVFIDGKPMADIDQFSNNEEFMVNLYQTNNLSYAPHVITLMATGDKNPESKGKKLVIDAFDIMHNPYNNYDKSEIAISD